MSTPTSTVPDSDDSDSHPIYYTFRHNLYFSDTGCAFFVFFFHKEPYIASPGKASARACLKIIFRQMCVPLCGGFAPITK